MRYEAGALLLDLDDPSRVLARTAEPLLSPETLEELVGTVPNVVFPTAIEEIEGALYVFYGMADTSIGVARLDRAQRILSGTSMSDSSISDVRICRRRIQSPGYGTTIGLAT